jgi:hypothetical protein
MLPILNACAVNPLMLLYGLLAATHVLTVVEAKAAGHGALARCHLASAILYGLVAACYIGHI